MSKTRSRKEKQKAQALRGIAKGNPDVLRSLADRQPELAARHLGERLRANSASDRDDREFLAIAERLTGRLRRDGKLSVARTLAEAGGDRSARLRLEQALCAFAMGDDAAMEHVARENDAHAPILNILRQTASGAPPAEPPETCPPGVRALHAVASAAVCAASGDVQRAVQWARDVPGPLQSIFFAGEMETAAKLAESPLTTETIARAAAMPSSRAWLYATVRTTFVTELSDKAPDLALNIARHHGIADEIERRAALQALWNTRPKEAPSESDSAAAQRKVQETLDFVRRFGAAAFGDSDRPAALLFEAYAWMQKDRRKAARSLESAIAKGADLFEALRAQVLLAMSRPQLVCMSCGFAHESPHKGVAAAADRLARALRHDPDAAPLATEAAILATEAWLAADAPLKARASVLDARRSARTLPAFGSTLDVLEASTIAFSEPNRARTLVEAVIEREPTSVVAWKLRIMLARCAFDDERADALVLEAAAATDDPRFREEASEIRAELDDEEHLDATGLGLADHVPHVPRVPHVTEGQPR